MYIYVYISMTILINIYLKKCIKRYVLIRGILENQSLIDLQNEIGKILYHKNYLHKYNSIFRHNRQLNLVQVYNIKYIFYLI